MPDQPILIVGGGLGGLTAALALAQRGRAVRVFEGAPAFGAIGYGIQFGPNVFHVFDRLGLMEQVMAVGDEPAAVTMRDGLSDEELVRIPTGAGFKARFNYPYLIIHRIDLHDVMIDACRADGHIELIADTRITGYANRGTCAEITTEGGETHEGELVIGADGIGSTLRAQMFDDGGPLPNGYVAHRTIIPMEELKADVPTDVVVLWGGPGFHIVTYPPAARGAVQHRRRLPVGQRGSPGRCGGLPGGVAADLFGRPPMPSRFDPGDGFGAPFRRRRPSPGPQMA